MVEADQPYEETGADRPPTPRPLRTGLMDTGAYLASVWVGGLAIFTAFAVIVFISG